MTKLFISHSSADDAFVRDIRAALADHGQEGWIDSRELRGGDPLWTEIQKAIETASAFAVVVSPAAFQSDWVGDELAIALKVQKDLGRASYPVIPLALDGTKLGVFKKLIGEEPVHVDVSSEAGGVEAAMNAILVALGKRLPADVPAAAQPKAEPLEELVLELTDLKFHEKDGMLRPSAHARLVYEPATPGQPDVHSVKGWRLVAPIGPIEAEELRWYLEKYAIWPSHYFRDRARKVEENLVKWGQLLYEVAMPMVHTANVMSAWAKIGNRVGRRFSVHVDATLEDGADDSDVKMAKEAATLLLALPWELLHDSRSFLFQGGRPVRVRRRLPGTEALDVPVVATPIRILLVTARPEDDACGYIDHRASALALVEAMESLPGLVKIHVLSPPTLPALSAELERAAAESKPYHVVHFDGHGVFSSEVGLGGLCFEHPDDTDRLEKRRHLTVYTNELGPLLHNHRIPLVFLEACQTALAEKASESVASELLKVGVASVVAMSHNVLVETARRFVEAFYEALADGKRVGDAMLAGQRDLKNNTSRGRIFGVGELRLDDWFVPVLYQEKDDPQLFWVTPTKQTQEDFRLALAARLGALPRAPETGFIGRSRELLALQRLLREERYAVVRGQGGEGKTALAAEFARWVVRSQQIHRAAFVSVETHGNERAVVDALGKQLVNKDFSAAGDLKEAIKHVERALREQPALLLIDNMESVLLPPFMKDETPEALSEDAAEDLKAILVLCERLLKAGDTRLIFTSREVLPTPFDVKRNRRELHQLDREDAVKLVERVLNAAGGIAGNSGDAAREEIEQLVDAVHCHARTLALLAPSLLERGVEATRESLVELMEDMEKNFPGSREKSVFASVELSLRRMSGANQDRAHVLGVFYGGVDLDALRHMMQWEEGAVSSLALDLVETGLATPDRYGHLTLNPALCPYLRGRMNVEERESLTARWFDAMRMYSDFLQQQHSENIQLATTLTLLELPNLFALLNAMQRTGNAEATVALASSLYQLLQALGKPRLLERIWQVRDEAAKALGDAWNHAQFQAMRNRIEQQLGAGQLREALKRAEHLLRCARLAGEQAYSGADYDLGMACILLARVLNTGRLSEHALPFLDEAQKRFEAIGAERPSRSVETMVSACFSEKGECLWYLGRLDEAAAAYEEGIRRDERLGDHRGVAVGRAQIGSIRKNQRRFREALSALTEARERFTELDEPGSVALVWHKIGMLYHDADERDAAEDAYQKSLAITVRLGDVRGQVDTLTQLGTLYDDSFNRPEESVTFYRQAADRCAEGGDVAKESVVRHNLAVTLYRLRRLDEARQEISRAIERKAQFGHATEPWTTWHLLSAIEKDTGNPVAAADAKDKAIACYLAYRRDGGENHEGTGRISRAVTEYLLAGNPGAAASFLEQQATGSNLSISASAYIRALQAIVDGSRDRALADAPDLDYGMVVEILLLIETLEKQRSPQPNPSPNPS
ncbi:MAG TPA: TIR domain-containing protein [Pyrinomonadaceae bacterium]|nr:TIR domain-containing protein [Pyrinomonadaceae bacterium]